MNGQPNQGLASLTGGMGGSPNLGGAPQTPVMAQGAQPPQQPPQGGLSQDLLKALAAAKVKKMQEAAKRELELQMAQQQAASGADKKTVVQQLQEGVEGTEMQEMLQKLSGGIKQAGQMSAQPQPMSGGIAAAPGADQAAQPEAMATGGIVAFKKGGTEGEEKEEEPVDAYNRASNETWLGQGIQRGKAAVKDIANMLALRPWATDPERIAKGDFRTNAEVEGYTPAGYRVNERADQLKAAYDRQQAARPAPDERRATTSFDPMNPWANIGTRPAAINQERPLPPAGPTGADYEDMRGPQGGIPSALQRPPAQRPPALRPAPQPQRPAAIQQPNLNPPAAATEDVGGLRGLMDTALKDQITGRTPKSAEEEAIKKYKEMVAVDPELAKKLAARTAAVERRLESENEDPGWQRKLYAAMGQTAPGGGPLNTAARAVGNITNLEDVYKNKKAAAEEKLLGMAKTSHDEALARAEKLYGVGTAASKTAQEAMSKAMETASHVLNTRSVAETARLTRQSEEKIAAERNALMEKLARINAAAAYRPDISSRMQAELEKAKDPADIAKIVARYELIVKTVNPNKLEAPTKQLDPMQLMLMNDMIKSAEKSGDTNLANSLRKRLGEDVGGGNPPSVPPPGAVRQIGK